MDYENTLNKDRYDFQIEIQIYYYANVLQYF